MSIHIEPTTQEKRREHKKNIKGFALLIAVAAFAGGAGFMEGIAETSKSTAASINWGGGGRMFDEWKPFGTGDVAKEAQPTPLFKTKQKSQPDMPSRNPKRKAKECGIGDQQEACIDRCSTTYIDITKKGEKVVTNCNALEHNNPIGKAIKKYEACLIKSKSTIKVSAKDIRKGICLGLPVEVAKELNKFKSDFLSEVSSSTKKEDNKKTDYKGNTAKDFFASIKVCKKELKEIYKAKEKGLQEAKKKPSASKSDKSSCNWKGVASCYIEKKLDKKGGAQDVSYKCIPKDEKPKKDSKKSEKKNGEKCKAGEQNCKNLKGSDCKAGDKSCAVKNPDYAKNISGQGGNTTLPGGGGNDYLNNQNQSDKKKKKEKSSPLADFLKGLGGGKGGGGGAKSQQKKAKTPTCTLNISSTSIKRGERIRIKWTSSYAKRVDITNIGRVNVDSPSQGFTRAPSVKTTYALTATSKDGKSKCSKSVTVNVEGSVDGKKGVYPPRLSCTPSKAELGKKTKAEVTWSCPTKADKSKGMDFETEGKLANTIKFNIETTDKKTKTFTVQCLEGAKVIGENSCSIKIVKPIYDIIVWPTEVETDERVRVSWGALNMQSCTVKGLNNFNYNQQNGVIITTPFPKGVSNGDEVAYVMTCKTAFGKTVTKDVVVKKE